MTKSEVIRRLDSICEAAAQCRGVGAESFRADLGRLTTDLKLDETHRTWGQKPGRITEDAQQRAGQLKTLLDHPDVRRDVQANHATSLLRNCVLFLLDVVERGDSAR